MNYNNIATIYFHLVYVYTVIQMNLSALWLYLFENSLIVHWLRIFIFNVRSQITNYKIEPSFPYMCICSDDKELYVPVDNVFQTHLENTFNILANSVKIAPQRQGNEYLLIMRHNDRIISRIFRENIDNYNVKFVKTRRHLLSIEYTHPEMLESIPIELESAVYFTGNEILSQRFVLRCLQYQSNKYIFDNKYVLKIMDSKIKTFTLTASEYIVIGNTEYEKKSI